MKPNVLVLTSLAASASDISLLKIQWTTCKLRGLDIKFKKKPKLQINCPRLLTSDKEPWRLLLELPRSSAHLHVTVTGRVLTFLASASVTLETSDS